MCTVASSALERPLPPRVSLSQSFPNSQVDKIQPQATSGGQIIFGATPGANGTELYNYTLPAHTTLPEPPSWHVCIACDESFANPGNLRKHQREVCERKLDWVCPIWPHEVFGRLSELCRHHRSIHADACSNCCATERQSPSDHCKQLLSQCSRRTADKKAWGCPCCLSCFNTLEAWNQHKTMHTTHNEKVVNWSLSTMFRSLLLHHDLYLEYNKYNWSLCSWAHMGKDDRQTLRYALERHVLSSTFNSQDYSRLGMPGSLVWHTYRLGIQGSTYTAPVNATSSQIAMVPLLACGPIDSFPELQSMALNPQPQGSLESSSNCRDGHEQHLQDPPASSAAIECEDFTLNDFGTLEYQRAAGMLAVRHPDHVGNHDGVVHGPPPLADYVPTPKKGRQKANAPRKLLQGPPPIRKKARTQKRA